MDVASADELLGRKQVFIRWKNRHRAKPPIDICLIDREVVSWMKIGKGVKLRAAILALLREPYLVPPHEIAMHQRIVMAVENQLCSFRVRFFVLKHANNSMSDTWVYVAEFDLVEDYGCATYSGIHDPVEERE